MMALDYGEFDGQTYKLSYTLPDGERVTTEAVGSKRVASWGVACAFRDPRTPATTRRHWDHVEERLVRAPLGEDVFNPLTRCTFRIDTAGRLPGFERI